MATYEKITKRGTLQTTGNTATDVITFDIPQSSVCILKVYALAKQSGSPNCAFYKRRCGIVRDGSSAPDDKTVQDVWTNENTLDGDLLFVVDEPGNREKVQVQGVAATTIDWAVWATLYLYTP